MEALIMFILVSLGAVAFVALFGFIIFFAIRQGQKADASWAAAAQANGLQFSKQGFGSRLITGNLGGRQVRVDTFSRGSGKNRTTYTRIRTFFHPPLPSGLKIYREGFFQTLGKMVGTQDIETGDPRFDGQFMIKGDHPNQVLHVLDAQTRGVLLDYDAQYGLNVSSDRAYFERSGVLTDGNFISAVLAAQARVADVLARSSASVAADAYAPAYAEVEH